MTQDYNNATTEAHDNPLTTDEVTALVRALLQYDKLLASAIRAGLEAWHFNGQDEHPFFVLYSAARALYTEHGSLTAEMLTLNIRTWVQYQHVFLNPQQDFFLFGDSTRPGFIQQSFAPSDLDEAQQRAERAFYERILQRFLNVRSIKAGLQTIINGASSDTAPADPLAILEQFAIKAQKIKHIGSVITNTARMPEFGADIELPPPPIPTGCAWLDSFIGGIGNREVIGLLGPTGGGKTTMLISTAVRMAQSYWAESQNRLSVSVSYEGGADQVRPLCWAAAGNINRTMFVEGKFDWSTFSTCDNLKPYDLELPENRNGTIVLGERERWQNCMQWYNEHFFFLDFNQQRNAQTGKGGLSEIVYALRSVQEEFGRQIGFITIDWAGLMLARHMQTTRDANSSEYSRQLAQLADDIRHEICDEFDCSVLVAHQLAPGQYSKIPPGKLMDHTQASHGKGFATNLHACACINSKDPETHVSTINWSKIRGLIPPSTHGLVQIPRDLVDMRLVSDQYYIDTVTNRILRRGDIRSYSNDDSTRSRPLPSADTFAAEL